MTADTDGKHPFQTEVPLFLRIQEREDETAAGSVYVDGNVVAGLGIVCVERFVERFNIVIQSCPCNPLDRYDTDGVLVTHFQGFFRVECGFVKSQGHFAHFNLPQLGKLFPYHLETGGDNEVRLIERFALRLTFLTPAQPCSYTAQHTRFGRTDGERACFPGIFFRRVPQVGNDVDTFTVHYGDAGILGFIDVVDVDGFVHQLGCVFVHIGGDECSQVQTGLCLGEGLILHHLVSDFGSRRPVWYFFYRRGLQHTV